MLGNVLLMSSFDTVYLEPLKSQNELQENMYNALVMFLPVIAHKVHKYHFV